MQPLARKEILLIFIVQSMRMALHKQREDQNAYQGRQGG